MVTAPVARSFTNRSTWPSLTSPGTRFQAALLNATLVPSGENTAVKESLLPTTPEALAESSVTAPVSRSLM